MTNPEEPIDPGRDLPHEQNPSNKPVVIAPNLPAMEKTGEVKTVLRNPLLPLMGAAGPQSTGGEGMMSPVPEEMPSPAGPPEKPQEARPGAAPAAPGEGYVRMEFHYEDGKLSIVGAKQVPGPLTMPSAVIDGYAYEVVLDGQQIALGSIPDVGVRRAFANRDVPDPQGKHYIINVPSFDFFVRVPQGHVSTQTLPRLNIVLHRVEEAPDRFTTLSPLAQQPGVKTEEVARLAGIRLEQLSPAVRPLLEEILRQAGSP